MPRLRPSFVTSLSLVLLAACAAPDSVRHRPAADALGPYSASVEHRGLLFVSGQIGERGQGFEHEVATALDRVEAQLARAGLGWGDVVSATVYLTDMQRYGAFNELYAERLPAPRPARACVAVAALPGQAQVEIQVVAGR